MSTTSHNTVGRNGKCSACQLFLKSNAKMKHPNQMKLQPQFKEAHAWLKKHKPTISDSAYLCSIALCKANSAKALQGIHSMVAESLNYVIWNIVSVQYMPKLH